MVPEIAFGHHTRVVLDVGCGVASFGAYLLSRDVITMSVAPKDVHENQIQFALERGVPAMVAAFATRRLLYPSQAFDLIHCSRCRINWTRDGMSFLFAYWFLSLLDKKENRSSIRVFIRFLFFGAILLCSLTLFYLLVKWISFSNCLKNCSW